MWGIRSSEFRIMELGFIAQTLVGYGGEERSHVVTVDSCLLFEAPGCVGADYDKGGEEAKGLVELVLVDGKGVQSKVLC
ncbi:hypothetical protein Ancab_028854, partial [Ancistrocladus abbreviatus]